MRQVSEIDGLKKAFDLVEMIRKPQIIVRDLANIPAARLAQDGVSMRLSVPLAFLEGMSSDTDVLRLECARGLYRLGGRAIADDMKFEATVILRQDRVDRERQELGWPVNREQDRKRRIHDQPPVTLPKSYGIKGVSIGSLCLSGAA